MGRQIVYRKVLFEGSDSDGILYKFTIEDDRIPGLEDQLIKIHTAQGYQNIQVMEVSEAQGRAFEFDMVVNSGMFAVYTPESNTLFSNN